MQDQSDRDFKQQFEDRYKNCIYRYRTAEEKNIKALENNRLYFSTPVNFNDPYDNLIYANLGEILRNVFGNLQRGMDDYLEKLKEIDPEGAFVGYKVWNSSKKEKLLDMHCHTICNAIDFIKKGIRNNVKVICFSEIYNSMLMWSHYADDHRGYLLIYDRDDLEKAERYTLDEIPLEKKIRLEKVKYVEKQIDLTEDIENYVRYNMLETMGDVEPQDGSVAQWKLRESVIQKSKEWSYEKEWRMIPRIIELEKESELGYIQCMPKGVVLGAHCPAEDSEKIINAAKRNGLPIYRMFLNEFSPMFQLNIGEGENARVI